VVDTAPLPQTRASALAQAADPVAESRGREAAILLCVLRHPALLESHADALAAVEFAHPDLDALRHALLLADHDPSKPTGSEGCSGPDTMMRLQSAPHVAAMRWASASAGADDAAAGLEDALALLSARQALGSETADAMAALSGEAEHGALDDRLRAAAEQAWRRASGRLPENAADDAEIARELRDAVTGEIWVKRKRSRTPNR
jgi:DNA primase